MPLTVVELRQMSAELEAKSSSSYREVQSRLLDSIPMILDAWKEIEARSVVREILANGKSRRLYERNHLGRYGFTNFREVELKMTMLERAWGDVRITTKHNDQSDSTLVVFEACLVAKQ